MKNPNNWMFSKNGHTAEKKPLFSKARAVAFLEGVFKFFASLKLAIVTLSLLIVVLAAGTIVESLHGMDASAILVYNSPWFNVLLVFLGLNVFAATLDRLPWQRKHIGFLITHLGIITVLVGSLVTKEFMIDGQMPIAEGETDAFITLSDPLLYVYSNNLQRDWLFDIDKKAFAWEGDQKLKGHDQAPFETHLLHYYPKAEIRQTIKSSESGPAALKVTLQNSFMNQEQWLIENDASLGTVEMGPARLSFSDALLKEETESRQNSPFLEFVFENGQSVRLPVASGLPTPAALKLEGTPYRVLIQRVLRDAVVDGSELVDRAEPESSGFGSNPAVEFIFEGNGIREMHTVFTRFPEFPTVHGMEPSRAGMKVYYRMPEDAESQAAANELRFVKDPNGKLLYQVKHGAELKTGEVTGDEAVSTGWMDIQFKVQVYYPHSKRELSFVPRPNKSEAEGLTSAVQVALVSGGNRKEVWLAQGVREQIEFNGARYHIIYGLKRMPIGFKIKLKDFQIKHYPGTNQPAQFSSDVVLLDGMRGVEEEHHISMNEPMEYRGFKVYQAAYQLEPGKPEVSVFSVGKDPGVPIKYAGSLIMIAGIVTMFSMRKFSKRK